MWGGCECGEGECGEGVSVGRVSVWECVCGRVHVGGGVRASLQDSVTMTMRCDTSE